MRRFHAIQHPITKTLIFAALVFPCYSAVAIAVDWYSGDGQWWYNFTYQSGHVALEQWLAGWRALWLPCLLIAIGGALIAVRFRHWFSLPTFFSAFTTACLAATTMFWVYAVNLPALGSAAISGFFWQAAFCLSLYRRKW